MVYVALKLITLYVIFVKIRALHKLFYSGHLFSYELTFHKDLWFWRGDISFYESLYNSDLNYQISIPPFPQNYLSPSTSHLKLLYIQPYHPPTTIIYHLPPHVRAYSGRTKLSEDRCVEHLLDLITYYVHNI